MTVLQQEYKKQINRLKRAVKRGEKQGYIFPENIIPEMPKRVTRKKIEEIKQVKPKHLYAQQGALHLDTETGKVVPAKEYRKEVQKQAQEKRKKTIAQKKAISTGIETVSPKKEVEQEAPKQEPIKQDILQQKTTEEIPQEDISDVSIYERIYNVIDNLPRIFPVKFYDGYWGDYDATNHIDDVLTQMEYDKEENLEEYIHYLQQQETRIFTTIDELPHASEQQDVEAFFDELLSLVSSHPLSLDEVKANSEYNDFIMGV